MGIDRERENREDEVFRIFGAQTREISSPERDFFSREEAAENEILNPGAENRVIGLIGDPSEVRTHFRNRGDALMWTRFPGRNIDDSSIVAREIYLFNIIRVGL